MLASVLGRTPSVVADAADATTQALRPVRLLGINTSQAHHLISLIMPGVPAWIAGTQWPWRATLDHIPVFWIPAIHAGMTDCFLHKA